jgi:DNA-binding transcriptional MerR regulator
LEQATLLTLPQLADAIGVGYRTLHTWLQRGLIRPSLQRSRGTGVPNLFTPSDAVKAQVIAELRKAGVSFALLTEASNGLDQYPSALTDGAMVLVNGTVTVTTADRAVDIINREALTLVYNTQRAIDKIRCALTEPLVG